MKKQFAAVFLLAALTMTILAGCQSVNADTHTNEDPISQVQPAAEAVKTAKTATQPSWISAPHAENIALNHAGLTADEVEMVRTELDKDEHIPHYEIEFRAGHYEFDYEIDATTGDVLHYEQEYDQEKVPVDPPAPAEVTPEALISAQEAEDIALQHAGLSRQDVIFDRTELDLERNRTEYEVEFRAGRWEYSYEIDAVTGQILDYEKEYDD